MAKRPNKAVALPDPRLVRINRKGGTDFGKRGTVESINRATGEFTIHLADGRTIRYLEKQLDVLE